MADEPPIVAQQSATATLPQPSTMAALTSPAVLSSQQSIIEAQAASGIAASPAPSTDPPLVTEAGSINQAVTQNIPLSVSVEPHISDQPDLQSTPAESTALEQQLNNTVNASPDLENSDEQKLKEYAIILGEHRVADEFLRSHPEIEATPMGLWRLEQKVLEAEFQAEHAAIPRIPNFEVFDIPDITKELAQATPDQLAEWQAILAGRAELSQRLGSLFSSLASTYAQSEAAPLIEQAAKLRALLEAIKTGQTAQLLATEVFPTEVGEDHDQPAQAATGSIGEPSLVAAIPQPSQQAGVTNGLSLAELAQQFSSPSASEMSVRSALPVPG